MKLLREPLVHFLLLGAGLFFLAGLLGSSEGEGNKRIVVSSGRLEHLVAGFSVLGSIAQVRGFSAINKSMIKD